MKPVSFKWSITLLVVIVNFSLIKAFVCPTRSIWPCVCTTAPFYQDAIECYHGDEITQNSVNNAFAIVREANNLTSDDWLVLGRFQLHYSNLTEFDLTPLLKSRIHEVSIKFNMGLSVLVGPSIENNSALIDTVNINIENNALTDYGLGDNLKYFVPDSLIELGLARNTLMGAAEFSVQSGKILEKDVEIMEFIPGLSVFTNLEVLRLSENVVQRLRTGQFMKNNRLREIYLDWNQIKEIQENAFLFDETPGDILNETLWIDLHLNKRLSADTFHENHGLESVGRQATLYMDYLNLETLPQGTFEKFLDAHQGNVMKVWATPLVCDERVKWLKVRREEFENFVHYANCTNDPGFNVFNTNVIN